ncbi:MAG: glycosyltransferase family 2 protein [Raineya sp.]|nr:glycosyltransferase family 2 protein [Raineya sp.]MDW8296640.1 glycosyltransferase family 2 protein [Raineya sp.]
MKKYFYKIIAKYLNFYINEKDSVFELHPLNNLLQKYLSSKDYACGKKPTDIPSNTNFVILNGTLHYEKDIQKTLKEIHYIIPSHARLIVTYYSALWSPLIKLATWLGIRDKTPQMNWITHYDLQTFANLTNFEVVQRQSRILVPFYIPVISYILNRWILPLPIFQWLGILNVAVLRPKFKQQWEEASVSVIVPARNEAGNIEQIVQRLPRMGKNDELIFIEGGSKDNTWGEIQRVQELYKEKITIRSAKQDGKGKGDAVRKGFAMAQKEILMILDADMTVPPEDLPKFYEAIKNDLGEFINGSRLVYPMEKEAMRFLNLVGNKFFAMAFSFVLNQPIKDTLCGTKVISKKNYEKLAQNRNYFGNFDPFGDFDLLFGASRMGLKIIELPIAYKARTYGTTNIQRWKHGWMLLKMLVFAAKKIKFL